MTDLVDATEIERIVGIGRHDSRHYGKAVSSEQTVYILHSALCKTSGRDLRECAFSLALDTGIDEYDWSDAEDMTVRLTIDRHGKLVPARLIDDSVDQRFMQPTASERAGKPSPAVGHSAPNTETGAGGG